VFAYVDIHKVEDMKQEDRQRLLAEILKERAQRLNVPLEKLDDLEDSQEPRFLQAVRSRAQRLGTTPEDVRSQDIDRLRVSRYPGPDCLEPEEIEQFALTGILAGESLPHVEDCAACRGLLKKLSPSTEGLESFLAETRSHRVAPLIGPVGAQESASLDAIGVVSKRPSKADLADLVLAAAPVAVAVGVVYVLSNGAPEFLPRDPMSATVMGTGVLLLVVGVCLALAARWPSALSLLLTSRGALAGGTLVAAVAMFVVLSQLSDRVNASVQLGEYQLREFVLASMDSRQSAGNFLPASAVGKFAMRTEQASSERTVYEAAAKGIPGTLVADIRPDTGYLWWQVGKERDLRASFVAGRVKRTLPDGVVIEDPAGNSRMLKLGGEAAVNQGLKAGAFIIAALDSTKTVVKVQEVGQAR
jgi:hypothetical protein